MLDLKSPPTPLAGDYLPRGTPLTNLSMLFSGQSSAPWPAGSRRAEAKWENQPEVAVFGSLLCGFWWFMFGGSPSR